MIRVNNITNVAGTKVGMLRESDKETAICGCSNMASKVNREIAGRQQECVYYYYYYYYYYNDAF